MCDAPARAAKVGNVPEWLVPRTVSTALTGQCCVGRSHRAGDWGDVLGLVFGVCWLPVPAGGDRGCGPVVSAVRLSYRDVEELLAERGVTVDHVTVYRWVQRFTPEFIEATSGTTFFLELA
jgi:hypothetical protein